MLLRIYEDNDFLNYRGRGTDNAYTNGLRFDLFYIKNHSSSFFIDRLMPTAGDSSINIFGWGLMQTMFTPNDISKINYQPDDYSYSGALFTTHTLYSYNATKKFDFQTELILGVRGPMSGAAETQIFVHRLINYQRPMGWNNQLSNDLLLNINFTAEKQFAAYHQFVEIIGGAQVFTGTQMNGAGIYSMIRIGKMNPYFNGYMKQYTSGGSGSGNKSNKKIQAYLIIKPETQLVFSNALIEGGLFSTNKHIENGKSIKNKSQEDLHHLVYSFNMGAVISLGHFSISFIQNSSTPMMKGTYSHEVGNISMYVVL